MTPPLTEVKILEVATGVAAAYAGKMLADYGAEVIKVEPPTGDPARRLGPFPGNEPHPERSGLFLHLNTNKKSVVLDATAPDGAAAIRALAAESHIVIEDAAPGVADAAGWGWNSLSARRDDLVMLSVTPFGQTGPYRDYRGSEITLQAIGGPMHQTGNIEREPLKLGGHMAHYHAGLTTALAALMALRRAEAGGGGDYVDVAVYECQAGFRDRRTISLTAAAYTGYTSKRSGIALRVGAGIKPCLDGYVNLMAFNNRLPPLLKLIGREDLVGRPEFTQVGTPEGDAIAGDFESSYLEYLVDRPMRKVIEEAQASGIIGGAILTIEDLVKDPHYRDRGEWDTIDHPETGPLEYPGRPFIMAASPRPKPQRAPLLGEHSDEVLGGLALDGPAPAQSTPADWSRPRTAKPPLDGVRVAAITVVWAGPNVTQQLAEWGADVIRVEPTNRIQPQTRGAEGVVTQEQGRALAEQGQTYSGYPDFDPADDRWNRNPAFNSHARNKRSMSCDIMSPEGREAFLRLIAKSDVLVENNVPPTIDKARIGWEELKAVNPRLIMLRMPAFGLSGPYSNYRAFGTQAEGMVGHHHVRGYADATPDWSGDALTADGINGVQGAVAVMMALRHRERTGEGQLIELPLAEGFLPVLAEFTLDYAMNGHNTPPQANTHPRHAPHNAYACSGDDNWIAIDVGTDDEFAALCTEIGSGGLPADQRFATAEARLANRTALDHELSEHIVGREKEELFHALQARGVVATPVHNDLEALADPQLAARKWFRNITMEGVGTHDYPGYLFKMLNTPDDVRLPPCRLGEHSEEIYLDLLGYSREEYESLVDRGLVGDTYTAEALPPG